MSSFHSRIEAGDTESIWSVLRRDGFIDEDTKSVVVHDIGRMRSRLQQLKAAFPESTLHSLAIKANPLVEVLRIAVECGIGLEAASIEEVHLALAAQCPAPRIVFDSPAKTNQEIREAISLGVHLNVDHFAELTRVARALEDAPSESGIGLRINPEVRGGSISHTSVGSIGSKFGVSINTGRDQIFDAYQSFPWLTGIHLHVGSQGCPMELLVDAVEKVSDLRDQIELSVGRAVPLLNIGGGLPAAYFEDDCPATPREYAERLRSRLPKLWEPDTTLATEFGRSVQAGCGIAFSRVEYVREIESEDGPQRLAVIHLGADFMLRPVYRSSDWKHEFLVLDGEGSVKATPPQLAATPPQRTTIAGPLCFSGDILARGIALPDVVPGDWIAIRDCGAYTLSMWSRHCSRAIPVVAGYDAVSATARRLRACETPRGIVDFWSAGISS